MLRRLRDSGDFVCAVWLKQEDAPNTIRHTSIHKAKGLDSKAVILIGLLPHENLASDYDHFSWFMAVSRARQLLAVVESV